MKEIFSGDSSSDLWDDINNLDNLSAPEDIRNVIYFLCCKIQELETKFDLEIKRLNE